MSTNSTNEIRKIIDKLSSISFFLSLVTSKIQYIPVVNIATPFLNLLTLCFVLTGYSLWYAASHFYPDHNPKFSEWYGFTTFKHQNTLAASVGVIAAILSIIALTLPSLAVPATWLFFSSNIIWAVGQYHKLQNPPANETYSRSYQKSYLSYAIAMTSSGLVSALAATAILFFPIYTIPVIAVSSLINLALSFIAAEYWLNYTFEKHPKTPVPSYDKMTNRLGPTVKYEDPPSHEPYHSAKLLARVPSTPSETPEIELTEQNSPTHHGLC